MPIYLGRTENTELSIGGLGIGEAYVGNVQVFSSGPQPWIFIGEETGWMPGKKVTSAYRDEKGLHSVNYNPESGIYNGYGCSGHTKGDDCSVELQVVLDTRAYQKVYFDGEITHNMNGTGTRYARYYRPSVDKWYYVADINDHWDGTGDHLKTVEIPASSDDYIILEMKAGFTKAQVEDISIWLTVEIKRLVGE